MGATPGPDEETTDTGTASSSVNSVASNSNPPIPNVSDTVLATGGYDHTIKLWQIHTANCIKTFEHGDSQVNCLAVNPERRLVAAGGFQHLRIYDVHSSNQAPTLDFEGLTKNVTTLGFNKDGSWMYSGGEDQNARIWDLRLGSPQCQKVYQTHKSPITCATLHPNNTDLIVSDQSGTVHIWDLRNDQTEQLVPDQNDSVPIQCVSVDPLGKYLAAVTNKGDGYVWKWREDADDPQQLSPHHRMKSIHSRYALRCVFSPDSNYLATTSADHTAKIWSAKDGNFEIQQELTCSAQRWVWGAAFTGDSQFLLTASSDNLTRLWCIETGQVKREYEGHQKSVTSVAYRDPLM